MQREELGYNKNKLHLIDKVLNYRDSFLIKDCKYHGPINIGNAS